MPLPPYRSRSLHLRLVVALVAAALCSGSLAGTAHADTSPVAGVADGKLSGTVRTAAGAVAANSTVTLLDASGADVAHTTTDSAGRYALTVAQGQYTERIVTTVQARRFAAQIAAVVIGPSTNRDVIVVAPLVPPVTVTGTVRDLAGNPMPGVLVWFQNGDADRGGSTTTAPDGTYRLSAAPGTYTVGAQYESGGNTYSFNANQYILEQDSHLDLTIGRPLQPVVVHDEGGAPVAGAWVAVHSPYNGCRCSAGFDLFPGATRTVVSWGAQGRTDATGTVELPLFGDGVISVQPPPGRAELAPMPDTHYPAAPPSPLVLVEPSVATATNSQPTVTFQGHVRDSAGHIPDATISLSAAAGPADEAPLDPAGDGSFSLAVPPGHYALSIYGYETNHNPEGDSGGAYPDLSIAVADLNLNADRVQDITIPTRSLPIQILDRDGNPTAQSVTANSDATTAQPITLFAGATATAHLVDSGATAADGTTTLQVLSGSTVSLAAGWGQYPLGTAAVSGDDSSSATIHLSAVTLSGTLHDPRGVMGEPTWESAWVSLDTNPCNPPTSTVTRVKVLRQIRGRESLVWGSAGRR